MKFVFSIFRIVFLVLVVVDSVFLYWIFMDVFIFVLCSWILIKIYIIVIIVIGRKKKVNVDIWNMMIICLCYFIGMLYNNVFVIGRLVFGLFR